MEHFLQGNVPLGHLHIVDIRIAGEFSLYPELGSTQDVFCRLIDLFTFFEIFIVQIQKNVFNQMLKSRIVDNVLHSVQILKLLEI